MVGHGIQTLNVKLEQGIKREEERFKERENMIGVVEMGEKKAETCGG